MILFSDIIGCLRAKNKNQNKNQQKPIKMIKDRIIIINLKETIIDIKIRNIKRKIRSIINTLNKIIIKNIIIISMNSEKRITIMIETLSLINRENIIENYLFSFL